jgi:alkylation response protein AidB-like acyl-CoA dehydrogenase
MDRPVGRPKSMGGNPEGGVTLGWLQPMLIQGEGYYPMVEHPANELVINALRRHGTDAQREQLFQEFLEWRTRQKNRDG